MKELLKRERLLPNSALVLGENLSFAATETEVICRMSTNRFGFGSCEHLQNFKRSN